MKCTRCGFEMGNNTVCPGCGMVHTAPAQAPVTNPTPTYATTPHIPAEYTPISPWGYFGWNLLFTVPIVGFIVLLIFALGGTKNINLKNYARSFFCVFLISLIISIVLFVILAVTGAIGAYALQDAAANSTYYTY